MTRRAKVGDSIAVVCVLNSSSYKQETIT